VGHTVLDWLAQVMQIKVEWKSTIHRTLGYSGASKAYHGAVYGQGTGTILLDNTGCSGSESFIWDCSHLGWTKHNCHHYEDSSVDCNIT
ncbi:deleted in malignant brain tumors 1, partial [Paramuricea clavata]